MEEIVRKIGDKMEELEKLGRELAEKGVLQGAVIAGTVCLLRGVLLAESEAQVRVYCEESGRLARKLSEVERDVRETGSREGGLA